MDTFYFLSFPLSAKFLRMIMTFIIIKYLKLAVILGTMNINVVSTTASTVQPYSALLLGH